MYYKAYIYSFKLDSKDFEKLNTHRFVGANRSWLDYVIKNRTTSYNDNHDNYDIVIGKVADANAQFLFDVYLTNGNYSNSAKDTLIKVLKTSNLIDQYCFKTPKSIQLLNNNNMQRKEV